MNEEHKNELAELHAAVVSLTEAVSSQDTSLRSILRTTHSLNRGRMKLDIQAAITRDLLAEMPGYLAPEKVEEWNERRAVIERETRHRYLACLEDENPGFAAEFDDRPESETKDLGD